MEAQDLFALDGLTDLSARTGANMRPTLLRVLTDLYVHRCSHTAAEERHYTELALRLLEVVDQPTRIAVARRLARYPSPPLRVLQWLARDLPEVAAELRAHPLLQPIAAAPKATSAAKGVSGGSDGQPATGARGVDAGTAGELNDMFFAASADERRLILLNLHVVAPISADSVRVSRDPSCVERMEAALLGGHHETFARNLAQALQIPLDQARRIARDPLGEPVVVAAKALSMRRDVLYRILMFINPTVGHSVARVHALAALYEEMPQPAAEGMVAIWQALPQDERTSGSHQPLTWHDDPRRRAPSMPLAPRVPVARRTSGRRSAS